MTSKRITTRRSAMLKTVKEELTCSVCCVMFLDPYTLHPCEHTFCNECISTWLTKTITCPLCRKAPIKFKSNKRVLNKIQTALPRMSNEDRKEFEVIRHQNKSYCFLTDKLTAKKLRTIAEFQCLYTSNTYSFVPVGQPSTTGRLTAAEVQEKLAWRPCKLIPNYALKSCAAPSIDLWKIFLNYGVVQILATEVSMHVSSLLFSEFNL